jgi:hypothetical protein
MPEEQAVPDEWQHPPAPQAVRISNDGRVAILLLVRNLVQVFREGEPYGYRHGDEVEQQWVLVSAPNGVLHVERLEPDVVDDWTEVHQVP